MIDKNSVFATGRRKNATAQVRVMPGTGKITVNNKTVEEYFQGNLRQKEAISKPLKLVKTLEKYDIYAKVNGGGITGQSGAIMLGIARACKKIDAEAGKVLRKAGCLTRDPRMVERKKSGQPKARKKFQFSKR